MGIAKKLSLTLIFSLLVVTTHQHNHQSKKGQDFIQTITNQLYSIKGYVGKVVGNYNDYIWELIFISLVIIYGINYFLGKRLNEKYANKWIQANKPIFEAEFSQVGINDNGELLEVETPNHFKFFASGRKNCVYAMVMLEFKKRHDLLSMAIFNLFWPQKDRIRIEIPIDTVVNLPFLLAIVRKKEAKFVHDNYPDIKNFCRRMTHDELERRYVVLGEDEEISEFVLTSSVIAMLKKYENTIEMISFTDQKKPHKQVLRIDMQIPNLLLKNPQEFQNIIKMTLTLADHIITYKMSNAARTKAEKARKEYDETKAKEERKEKQKDVFETKPKTKKKEEAGSQKKEEKKMQKKFVKTN